MTISVLMSVYCSEQPKFFDQAIGSVMEKQTLLPNQLVLVEDGKLTPELYAVVDKWKKRLGDKMTVLKQKENLGLTKSLNHGIKSISDDIIARMDSDDISLPERFRLQVEFLEKHPEIDILGGAIEEID